MLDAAGRTPPRDVVDENGRDDDGDDERLQFAGAVVSRKLFQVMPIGLCNPVP